MGNSIDFSGRPIHFIGIGGIGMSGLAYVLARRGLPVSGSDLRSTNITQKLAAEGAHIFLTQEASNLDFFDRSSSGQTPQIVCSTAIGKKNAELNAALERGCPIFHRSDVLSALIGEYSSIGVAGTHGKTTTSSMIGYLLVAAGVDPTIVVGGEVTAWDGNARIGSSEYFVAEVDESDGSLVKHHPKIGVITNIELDHTDHYKSLEQTIETFSKFSNQCQIVIGSADCQIVRERIQPTISYSVEPEQVADYTVDNIQYHSAGTSAQIYEYGKLLGTLKLGVLGNHNLSNALATIAVGRKIGLDFESIASGLATFAGAKRRFELKGYQHDITFIDDYAHHPSEILVTLNAARLRVGAERRVVAIFQPHRYSRTLEFLAEFSQSFKDADVVIITDIYSAGEENTGAISGEKVVTEIGRYHSQVCYQPTLDAVSQFLKHNLQPGDICLFLGAGNLNQIIPEIVDFYQAKARDEHPATIARS
ncbi:UDP-N-acetylmuramate--L-alanine ligase [Chamaesiphon polymorphus]|uniref:UDP-N-acetylmuramate--L-alanine ligase n=1 Tax=Chamaesiphon polymorphus CCALA 037 TaxID=2107692 RepID=A0A2T1GNP3_9CYAN|nr:UDP-N-acetylmuramate--L-alanine ligase [Chamaesiphon polymorphus]PSB59466.1 UDP-N-acetylmuramate--L-alanine ligase [Chamaesiphon polymorphus CCALA 037]